MFFSYKKKNICVYVTLSICGREEYLYIGMAVLGGSRYYAGIKIFFWLGFFGADIILHSQVSKCGFFHSCNNLKFVDFHVFFHLKCHHVYDSSLKQKTSVRNLKTRHKVV